MVLWSLYSLPIFIGILALVTTVVPENIEGSSIDSYKISPGSSNETPGSKTVKNSNTSRKKKNRKTKKEHKDQENQRTHTTTRANRVPYKGDGGLTPTTWKAAFRAGTVYMGPSYFNTTRYRYNHNKMPTICENKNLWNRTSNKGNVTDSPGVILFYCPGNNDPDDLDHCCGAEGYEECCSYQSPNVPLILGILSALVLVAVIIFGCCIWKRIHQKRELDKPPTEQIVAATLTDPMLPPAIITSPPPPPPQEISEEKVPPTDIECDGQKSSEPVVITQDGVAGTQQPQDNIIISSDTTPAPHPPPEAV